MRHLIIGAGPAGITAAETLRRAAPRDEITVLGDEPGVPYSRMAIPYLLAGRIDESGTRLRREDGHFRDQRIDLVQGRARSVDAQARQVRLESGEALAFDRLLIASGASARRPPIPGMDFPQVHACWTLEDARRIMEDTRPGLRVLQMGAGFIGCIIMEALAERGVELTVVEMGDRMVPRMMTPGAGAMIRQWCEGKGIRVLLGTQVRSIAREGAALRATLGSSETLDCDAVICATGVAPNIGFLEGSGIACDQGVLVNHRMETSVPGIFAAGDVAQSPEFGSSRCVVNAIQPAAAEQARIAALNMAGRAVTGTGQIAMNVLDTLGLVAASFGQWSGASPDEGGTSVELRDPARFRYLRLEFQDDRLIGATSLGLTEHVGVIRGLIQGRVRLGPWRERLLEDPTRLAEAYIACAQKAA